MRKQFKNNGFKKEDQIVWKNTTHEKTFEPMKNYYAIIKIGSQSYITEYLSKFRSEAYAIFLEEARLCNGKLEVMSVYK